MVNFSPKNILKKYPLNFVFCFEVISNSMYPKIKTGDYINVKKILFSNIKINDIVAFYNKNINQIVIHRVILKNKKYLVTKGDNNSFLDNSKVYENIFFGKYIGKKYIKTYLTKIKNLFFNKL